MNRQIQDTRILAFYLPQFHEIPENNDWWGPKFTEWSNTKKTEPHFYKHYQPREPLNNNYYDLTNPEAREWQAAIAKKYGIDGFVYYHYWFKGRRLLEKPFNEVLASKKPDFPFCLCWANEPWTRAWDGASGQVLIEQHYGDYNDWLDHFNYLLSAFKDPRYIKHQGQPVMLIYRQKSIDKCDEMLALWREHAIKNGFPGLHIISMLGSFEHDENDSFDAHLLFEPLYTLKKHEQTKQQLIHPVRSFILKTIRRLKLFHLGSFRRFHQSILHGRLDYKRVWQAILQTKNHEHYSCAFPDWDNSARKGQQATVIHGANPKVFSTYFKRLKRDSQNKPFLFINAWNEWAEGAYLEPDKKNGYGYLEKINDA